MEERYRGMYIIGETGTGKTSFLEHDIAFFARNYDVAIILIEAHGDFTRRIMPYFEPRRRNLLVLDAEDHARPFGLNIFDKPEDERLAGRAATQVMELFKRVWGDTSWGPQIEDTLLMVTLTAYDNPGFTLVDVPMLFSDADYRRRIVANVRDPTVRSWWMQYEAWSPFHRTEYTNSTLNKVRQWTTNPALMPIVGQSGRGVPWRNVMETGGIVLARLSPAIGETAVSLLGTALVNQITLAALSRTDLSEEDRTSVLFVCDEFHRFATSDFATLFNEGRKFGIMTTVAHQRLQQLHDPDVRAAATGAAIKVVFRVSGDDAIQLAKHFDHTPPPPSRKGNHPPDVLAAYARYGHPNPKMQALKEWLDTLQWRTDRRDPKAAIFLPILRDYLTARNMGATREEWISDSARWVSIWKGINHVAQNKLETSFAWRYGSDMTAMVDAGRRLRHDPLNSELQEAYLAAWASVIQAEHEAEVKDKGDRYDELLRYSIAEGLGVPNTKGPGYNYVVHLSKTFGETSVAEYRYALAEHCEILETIFRFGDMLEEEPILVPATPGESTYTPQRTYADMENEITTKLSHQKNYTAMLRTPDVETQITLPPRLPEKEPIKPYWVFSKREDVIAEIRSRYRTEAAEATTLADAPPPRR